MTAPTPQGTTREGGRELDREVCEALGIAGRVQWYAQAPGQEHAGSGWILGHSRHEVEQHIAEAEARDYPNDWRRGSTAECVTVYPDVSTYLSATATVIVRMRDLLPPERQTLHLTVYPYNRTYAVFGDRDSEAYAEGNGEHATEVAICLAALAALSSTPTERDADAR